MDEEFKVAGLNRDYSLDLYVNQSKTSEHFEEDAINRLIATFPALFDIGHEPDPAVYSQSLIQRAELFRETFENTADKFPKVTVTVTYATKGTTSPTTAGLQAKIDRLKQIITDTLPGCTVNIQLMGARELYDAARSRPATVHHLTWKQYIPGDSYVALIALKDYSRFLADSTGVLNSSIFDSNVRDWEGINKVNEQIKSTLESGQDPDFWWLNNGITLLCSRATVSGGDFVIEDVQIVNGLQTSVTIFERYRKDPAAFNDDPRAILVRIIPSADSAIRDRIIVATNSQTSLQPSATRATDPLQNDIEQYLLGQGLYYERRKNFYKNQSKPSDKILNIPYLAQAILAIGFCEPHVARARPSSAISADEDYQRLFNSSFPIQMYDWMAQVQKMADTSLRKSGLEASMKSNLKFQLSMIYAAKRIGHPVYNPDLIAGQYGTPPDEGDMEAEVEPLKNDLEEYESSHPGLTRDKIAKSQEFTAFLIEKRFPGTSGGTRRPRRRGR